MLKRIVEGVAKYTQDISFLDEMSLIPIILILATTKKNSAQAKDKIQSAGKELESESYFRKYQKESNINKLEELR